MTLDNSELCAWDEEQNPLGLRIAVSVRIIHASALTDQRRVSSSSIPCRNPFQSADIKALQKHRCPHLPLLDKHRNLILSVE